MNERYPLPRLNKLTIHGFDLYKCPYEIEFSKSLNIVFGTNGLGKTTLLTIIQYAIIGPYKGALEARNYDGKQKIRRPMFQKNYFRNRMNQINENAYVEIEFTLGKDIYRVIHSLYEHRLLKVIINNEELLGESVLYENYENKYFTNKTEVLSKFLINSYHTRMVESSGFPDENSLITMITEVMFFSEDRKYVFWDESLSTLLISKYFIDKNAYLGYEKAQQLVKMYDSQMRLKTYEMSFIKKFLGEDSIENESTPKKSQIEERISLSKLQNVQGEIKSMNETINKLDKQLNAFDKERIENRIKYENICSRIAELDNIWYSNIFPDDYQESYNRYVPSIINGECPFCNSVGKVEYVQINKCFFCGEEIKVKEKVNLLEIDIERKNKEMEKKIVEKNYETIKNEIFKSKREKTTCEIELNSLIEKETSLKKELGSENNENYIKYRKMELEKEELTRLLKEAKENEKVMRKGIDECVYEYFRSYSKTFCKYAYSFFGAKQTVNLKLVGDEEDKLFQFQLNGKNRESYYDLSESQRIFVDLSYRLSVLEFFHKSAYFICETPDSTLDILFEDNAVKTFSNYIKSGNTIFLSANARNSNLINLLMNEFSESTKIINLLDISNIDRFGDVDLNKLDIAKYLRR